MDDSVVRPVAGRRGRTRRRGAGEDGRGKSWIDDRVIPWRFATSSTAYAGLLTAAFLFLGMSLFQTREVG